MSRQAQVERRTTETHVSLSLELDGQGLADVQTGIGFFDHMLQLLTKHALWNLQVRATGDLHVDAHHTVEDVGIALGQALAQALGDKTGIYRYGHAIVPMDESLVTAAVDLSGRAFLVWQVPLPTTRLGDFDAELAQDFWQAVVQHAAMNLHVMAHHGRNTHHLIEAVFKACARALRHAGEIDPRQPGIPSTKGRLLG
ncbi:MAG: imidazoleglycerol-phosphate dehydratase HisB [Gemmatales bacterium]|nr:imidazoleglycerol-phosphate dehydratase HisB [Gemmatales bacterium]MDW7993040.1 imidazoleglycerol-phosphate dehydratase HisB [Gemmatales bacterium]